MAPYRPAGLASVGVIGVPDFVASVDYLNVHEHVGLARLVSGSVSRYPCATPVPYGDRASRQRRSTQGPSFATGQNSVCRNAICQGTES